MKLAAATATLECDEPQEFDLTDIEIHEPYIAILDRHRNQSVVTVIEVVSPSNKYAGPGRDSYLAKQREVLQSTTHLVEIDLLRKGPHVVAMPSWPILERGSFPYLISVNRARKVRSRFEYYPLTLQHRLPRLRIPLASPDPDIRLDLQSALERTYEAGAFRDRLAYDRPCDPPLEPHDQAWAEELIRNATKPLNGDTPPV